MKFKLLLLSGLTLMTFLFLYEGQGNKMRMYADAKAMKKEIIKKIPVGTPIQDAKRVMEENGFNCAFMEDSAFSEDQDGDPQRQIVHEGQDFLLCHKSKTVAPLMMREWNVIIVHKAEMVSEVFVNVGITGP